MEYQTAETSKPQSTTMEDISAILTIAPRINEVCDDPANVRAILKELQKKIALITDIVESVDNKVAKKNSALFAKMRPVFEDVREAATETRNMNIAIYLIRGADASESLRQMMGSIRLYVDSLKVDKSSTFRLST